MSGNKTTYCKVKFPLVIALHPSTFCLDPLALVPDSFLWMSLFLWRVVRIPPHFFPNYFFSRLNQYQYHCMYTNGLSRPTCTFNFVYLLSTPLRLFYNSWNLLMAAGQVEVRFTGDRFNLIVYKIQENIIF